MKQETAVSFLKSTYNYLYKVNLILSQRICVEKNLDVFSLICLKNSYIDK